VRLAPAVTLSGRLSGGKIACIVSGGNIDFSVLSQILAGETPGVGWMPVLGGRRPRPVEMLCVSLDGLPSSLLPGSAFARQHDGGDEAFSDRYDAFRRGTGDRRQHRPTDKKRRVPRQCGLDFPLVSGEDRASRPSST
jgi:hypothetical protein